MTGPYPPVRPYVEPPPGDPDGDYGTLATQLARGMRMEWLTGWEFTTTGALDGEEFDPDLPPPGDGWVLNEYAGDQGHSTKVIAGDREARRVHWRRRKP